MAPTLVLIHGAWMSPASWQPWVCRYEARGYRVAAPAWPYDDRPVAELVRAPDPALAKVGVAEILAHLQAEIAALGGPVVLIGHSFGGLFTQLLLDRGVGLAGVAIDPAPPRGVLPSFSALKAGLPALTGGAIARMGFSDFHWGWMHTQGEAEARAAYEAFVVPTPARVYQQGAAALFSDLMTLRPAARTQPLLMIAGEADRTVSADMVEAAFRMQRASAAPTELRRYPERTHWIIGQPGWEQVADDAIGWVESALGLPASA